MSVERENSSIPPAPRGSGPYETITQSSHIVKVSPPVEPSACRLCDVPEREHMQRWKWGVGWHVWNEPTMEQRKERMLARAAERSTPASGMPHTPAQGAREYCCPRCDRWARWTDGETDPVAPTFWCQTCSAETPIRSMDSRLQEGRGDPGASGTGSDSGTGDLKAHGRAHECEETEAREWIAIPAFDATEEWGVRTDRGVIVKGSAGARESAEQFRAGYVQSGRHEAVVVHRYVGPWEPADLDEEAADER